MSSQVTTARTFLFVPGDRPDRLPKALASGAHGVIVDLEDAVAAPQKEEARRMVLRSLATGEHPRVFVRINAAGTPWHEQNLSLLAQLRIAGVVVPKAEHVPSIERVARAARTQVIALVESAVGLNTVGAIARAEGVARLAFGHLDFQLDLGMECGPDERELDPARQAIVIASRCAGLAAPIDGVTTAALDEERVAADTARAMRLGFRGKLCIHPRQVEVVNRGLGPSSREVEWARRVVEAAAGAGEAGAFRLDGEMIDRPVLQRAHTILQAA